MGGTASPSRQSTTAIQRSRRNLVTLFASRNKKKPRGAWEPAQGFSFYSLLGRSPRCIGATVRRYGFRPYSHQQSNKASAALWFEPQRCKSGNAHLRDFLEQQFHIFFDKLAGVAAGRARSAKAGKALQKNHRFHLGRFALRAFLSRHDRPAMRRLANNCAAFLNVPCITCEAIERVQIGQPAKS